MAGRCAGIVLCGENNTQIQMCEPDVRIQGQRASKVSFGHIFPIHVHFRVSEVGQSLCVLRLLGQLRFELPARLFVALLFPIQIPQSKVSVRRNSRCLYRGLKLRGCGLRPVGRIERLA